MFIEVKGVQFVNKGAELMLYAIRQQLELRLPQAKLVLEPGVNSPFEKRAKFGALQKFAIRKGRFDLNVVSYLIPKKLRNWMMNSFGVIMESDIDVVLDASGFAYGDQWSSVKIKLLCGEILRSAKNNKKYVLLPQALGPFTRENDLKALEKALPKAALVCARDVSSFDNVAGLIRETPNLVKFGDFTNLVKPLIDDRWQAYTNLMLIIPNYNMLSERNTNNSWKSQYVQLMVESISQGRKLGLTPVILNHEGHEDNNVCNLIKAATDGAIEIFHEPDSRKVKGMISIAKLIVCSRFHGCVSALCQGVPCLGTSWSHKYEHLFEEYGLANCLLSPDTTVSELNSKITYALESSVHVAKDVRERFKVDSAEMWDKVISVIQ